MFKDLKFKESEFIGKDISSLPDNPIAAGMSSAELKARFDAVAKTELALGRFNELMDKLDELKLSERVASGDILSVREGKDELEYTTDNSVWKSSGSGHIIATPELDYPQRKKLRFMSAVLTDTDDATEIRERTAFDMAVSGGYSGSEADFTSALANIDTFMSAESPTLLGNPTAPTPGADAGNNSIATVEYVRGNGSGRRYTPFLVGISPFEMIGEVDLLLPASSPQVMLGEILETLEAGDSVTLREGIYYLTDALTITASDITITGCVGTVFQRAYSSPSAYAPVIEIAGNNVTLENLTIKTTAEFLVEDMVDIVVSGSGVTLRDITVTGADHSVSITSEADSCRIKSCAFEDIVWNGIMNDGTNTEIESCTFDGIEINTAVYSSGNGLVCTNNKFPSGLNAIYAEGSDNIISNNYIKFVRGTGIYSGGFLSLISQNIIEGAGSNGIHLAGGTSVATGNIVKSSSNDCISVVGHGHTVNSNICRLYGSSGISLLNSKRCTVVGNNVTRQNGFSSDYTASMNTIKLQSVQDSIVSNNLCKAKAVAELSSSNNIVQYNIV